MLHIKINLNGSIDVNLISKTIRLQKGDIGENHCDLRLGKDFLIGHKVHELQKKIWKIGLNQN